LAKIVFTAKSVSVDEFVETVRYLNPLKEKDTVVCFNFDTETTLAFYSSKYDAVVVVDKSATEDIAKIYDRCLVLERTSVSEYGA